MIKKTLVFLVVSILTGTIHAAPQKLSNYEAVKTELLEGRTLKAIVDFSQCKIIMGDSNKNIRHILGVMLENFMISDRTKGISVSHSFINSLDKRTPYGSVGYRLGDITIMPNNDVIIDTAVLHFSETTPIVPLRFLCKLAEGANFYTHIFE